MLRGREKEVSAPKFRVSLIQKPNQKGVIRFFD